MDWKSIARRAIKNDIWEEWQFLNNHSDQIFIFETKFQSNEEISINQLFRK